MPIHLAIDDALLNQALRLGGRRTKEDTVNDALREYIQRREQRKVIDTFGTVDYFEDYEPKKYRLFDKICGSFRAREDGLKHEKGWFSGLFCAFDAAQSAGCFWRSNPTCAGRPARTPRPRVFGRGEGPPKTARTSLCPGGALL